MKISYLQSCLIALFITLATGHGILAQDTQQWNLSKGAKARFGKGWINEIKYSPDGIKLAVASSIGIWIYDAQTGEELDLYTGHTGPVNSVAFSPDGSTLASGSEDNAIRFWDVNTGTHLHIIRGSITVPSLAYSPDGNRIISGSHSSVRLWNANKGVGAYIKNVGNQFDLVTSVAYSPDGNIIASGSEDNTIRFWDARTGSYPHVLRGHTDNVTSVAFSPDSNRIISGSLDQTVRLWNIKTRKLIRTLEGHTDGVNSISFSPDGSIIVSGSLDNTIRLWNADTGEHIRTIEGHTASVISVTFSLPDGNTIASSSVDNTIRFWNTNDGEHIRTIEGHSGVVNSIDYSPDGNTIASGSSDNALRLWNANTGGHLHTITEHTGAINSVAFSPDEKTVASASADNTIRFWDVNTGTHIRTLRGHTGSVNSVSFSPDGSIIASGSEDKTIRLWDANTGIHLRALSEHTDVVLSVSFSPDGALIASASADRSVRLWDANTGIHLRALPAYTGYPERVAFSPDSKTIATGSKYYIIRLWDANTGEYIRTLRGHRDDVYSIAFSPDGKIIATGSRDKTIHLWDANTDKRYPTLSGHTDHVTSVLFSPDSKIIATGSRDGTVLLWEHTLIPPKYVVVYLSPYSIQFPPVGEHFTLSLKITDGKNVAGYQAKVNFDSTALRYVGSANGDYLPADASFTPPVVDGSSVTLAASSPTGVSMGNGTLATITYEVVAIKDPFGFAGETAIEDNTSATTADEIVLDFERGSRIHLSDVLLTDSAGESTVPQTLSALITIPTKLPEDVNGDGVINIADLTLVASNFSKQGANIADVNGDHVVNIADLVLVAAAIGNVDAAAPALWNVNLDEMPTLSMVEKWLQEARQLNLADPEFLRGIIVLENLLKTLTPKKTALLANYPNPFNPETWIPYQLATSANVRIGIYTADGKLIRTLDLGLQSVGMYHQRSQAAYWDGRNAQGEPVASGVYFYTFSAGKFSATRKMLILK